MKTTIGCLLLQVCGLAAMAQAPSGLQGGGQYESATTPCLLPGDYERINSMLALNIGKLKAEGKLGQDWGLAQPSAARPTAGTFIWPLRQEAGFNYNSYYGISNYVDLDPLYPNHVKDWNCGARTYDQASGYNHQGVDIFLWPFSQQMQERKQVAIIAAADGVIIGKDDGNPDHSCALNNVAWNAVYIGNSDGTICWYGHMKTGSQTTKAVGQSVTAGEFLGYVGSSGNSTGPHLHFETHTGQGAILDPFSGPCNPGQSLWANQKPYLEPTINTLMTHDHAPVFPVCPQLETINAKDVFHTGDTLFVAAYYHDQNPASPSTYTIYRPDNSVDQTWTHTAPQYYDASYWYWSKKIDDSWAAGNWRFVVSYEGHTENHTFTVERSNSIAGRTATDEALAVVPNPNQGHFTIEGLQSGAAQSYRITDIAGREIAAGRTDGTGKVNLRQQPPAGIYILQLSQSKGGSSFMRFVVR